MKASVSVVIPSYNEEKAIPAVLSKVMELRASMPELKEIIIIDDGSTDDSFAVLSQYSDITVLRNKAPQGYGGALKQGFRHSQSELIAFLDMDDTYDVRDLRKMIDLLHSKNLGVVFGSRLEEPNGMPWLRRFGNVFYHRSLKVLGFPKIADPCTGMRLFRRHLVDSFCEVRENDLSFSIALTLKTLTSGIHYGETRINYNERIGKSKLNPLTDGGRFFWTILCNRFLA